MKRGSHIVLFWCGLVAVHFKLYSDVLWTSRQPDSLFQILFWRTIKGISRLLITVPLWGVICGHNGLIMLKTVTCHHVIRSHPLGVIMMTSSNRNIFRVTGHLCGDHRSPVNSPHKGQWRGALMFSLICAWINGWVNNGEAGDLRRHRAQYGVTVRICLVVYIFPYCDRGPFLQDKFFSKYS